MNVVDSSGWLEYFARGSNASFFAPVIQATDTLVVPTLCMYEVFKRLLTQRGEEAALRAIGMMSLGVIADLTREIAVSFATISTELHVTMAESINLATTRAYYAILWTQDTDFDRIEGVQYIRKK